MPILWSSDSRCCRTLSFRFNLNFYSHGLCPSFYTNTIGWYVLDFNGYNPDRRRIVIKMKKQRKNPYVAGILNFILYGLGYVYLGKRLGFGIGLIIWSLIFTTIVLTTPTLDSPLIWLDAIMLAFLFAYDVYPCSKEQVYLQRTISF